MYLLKEHLQDVALCTDIFTSVLRGETFRSVGARLGYSDSRISQLFYKIRVQMRHASWTVVGQVAVREFIPFQDEFDQLPRPMHYVAKKRDLEALRSQADRLIEYFHYLLGVQNFPDLARSYPEVTEPCTSLTHGCSSCQELYYTLNPNDRICYRCLQCARELQSVLKAFTQE